MSNRRDIQFTYSPHNKLTLLDCNFVVDQANGNGAGCRSVKGSGRIASVFMNSSASFVGDTHTSILIDNIPGGTGSLVVGMAVQGSGIPVGATIASIVNSGSITISAATSSSAAGGTITYQAVGNPNPPAGYIIVNLQDNYNRYLSGNAGFVAPVSGTPILVTTGVTANLVYIIVSVGTTSAAQWQKLGLPSNIAPAVGVSFVASQTTTATGTGVIEVPAAAGAGVFNVQVVGDPNQMNSTGALVIGSGTGMQIISACFKDSSSDAPVIANPADGSVVGMTFNMNNSAQGV